MINNHIFHWIVYIASWIVLPYIVGMYYLKRDEIVKRRTDGKVYLLFGLAAMCFLLIWRQTSTFWTAPLILPMVYIFFYPLAYKTPCNAKRLTKIINITALVLAGYYLYDVYDGGLFGYLAAIVLYVVMSIFEWADDIDVCEHCHTHVGLELIDEAREDLGTEYYECQDKYRTHTTTEQVYTNSGKTVNVDTHHIRVDDIISKVTNKRKHEWYRCPVCGGIIHRTKEETEYEELNKDGSKHVRDYSHD